MVRMKKMSQEFRRGKKGIHIASFILDKHRSIMKN